MSCLLNFISLLQICILSKYWCPASLQNWHWLSVSLFLWLTFHWGKAWLSNESWSVTSAANSIFGFVKLLLLEKEIDFLENMGTVKRKPPTNDHIEKHMLFFSFISHFYCSNLCGQQKKWNDSLVSEVFCICLSHSTNPDLFFKNAYFPEEASRGFYLTSLECQLLTGLNEALLWAWSIKNALSSRSRYKEILRRNQADPGLQYWTLPEDLCLSFPRCLKELHISRKLGHVLLWKS